MSDYRGCWPWSGRDGVRARRLPRQQLGHERDVGDCEAERLDAWQTLFVGKRRHFTAQLVERFVQIEHAPSLTDVGGSTLRHRCHSSARFLGHSPAFRAATWWCASATAACTSAAKPIINQIIAGIFLNFIILQLYKWPILFKKLTYRFLVNFKKN